MNFGTYGADAHHRSVAKTTGCGGWEKEKCSGASKQLREVGGAGGQTCHPSVPLYAYVRSSFTLDQSCSLQHTLFICTAHSLTITSSTLIVGLASPRRFKSRSFHWVTSARLFTGQGAPPLHSILFFFWLNLHYEKKSNCPAYASETRGGLTLQTSSGHVCRDIGNESAYVDIVTTDGIFEHRERIIVTRTIWLSMPYVGFKYRDAPGSSLVLKIFARVSPIL